MLYYNGECIYDSQTIITYQNEIARLQNIIDSHICTGENTEAIQNLQQALNNMSQSVNSITTENNNLKNCISEIANLSNETTITYTDIETIINKYGLSTNYKTLKINTNKGSTITIEQIKDDDPSFIDNNPKSMIAVDGITETRVLPGKYKVTSTTIFAEDDIVTNNTTVEIAEDNTEGYTIKITNMPSKAITYGIAIDQSNLDSDSAVTYIGNAEGMNPLSVNLTTGVCDYGDWEDIVTNGLIGCKPVLYDTTNDTVEYINPNNYKQLEDGTDITTEVTNLNNDKNVMVEFNKTWYRWSTDPDNENILRFEITNCDRSEEGFSVAAFTSLDGTNEVKDKMYYSAYEGSSNSNSIIKSSSGQTVTVNINFTNSRTNCIKNGSEFGMEDAAARYYVIGLMCLVTKSVKLQSKLGEGKFISGYLATGTMDDKGLFYGGSSSVGVKCFGIENFYGNYWNWIDGICTKNSSGNIGLIDHVPYTDNGTNYNTDYTYNSTLGSWRNIASMTPVLNGSAIMPKVTDTNTNGTKGWCDQSCVVASAGLVCCVGGFTGSDSSIGGPLCLGLYYGPSYSYGNMGVRCLSR